MSCADVTRALRPEEGETADDVGARAADVLLLRIRDPRNITAEEMRDPVVAAVYEALEPEAWTAAVAIARARAVDAGRIAVGPCGKRPSAKLMRLDRLTDHEHRARRR